MNKQTEVKALTPMESYQLLQDDPRAVLIDVRSNMEFLFVGHPRGAIHIPWMDEPDWEINPHFVADVRKVMLGGVACDDPDKCPPVLLICRSGKRSLEAARELLDHGFKRVYNVSEGFEGELDDDHHRSTLGGWRFHDLPWEQC